jgi:hypothetical protein
LDSRPAFRLGIDLDGVLADFETAYRAVEDRLFGPAERDPDIDDPSSRPEAGSETPAEGAALALEPQRGGRHLLHRHAERVWEAITATPDFWRTLTPLEDDVLTLLDELAQKHRWHVFFITQRPPTAGETVQRQTQLWLIEHGFALPSVISLSGPRGKVADALSLDYLVDDLPKNCIDVIADSKARPILILRDADPAAEGNARRMGIKVARSVRECLQMLDEAQQARVQPALLKRIARRVGFPGFRSRETDVQSS